MFRLALPLIVLAAMALPARAEVQIVAIGGKAPTLAACPCGCLSGKPCDCTDCPAHVAKRPAASVLVSLPGPLRKARDGDLRDAGGLVLKGSPRQQAAANGRVFTPVRRAGSILGRFRSCGVGGCR